MYNKRVLSTAVSELGKAKKPTKKRDNVITAKRHQQPIVSTEGFKQGPPPPGTKYRIPGDTLYNPTPYTIDAVSDNGIRKTLNPGDTKNVHFPGATYVDEYKKMAEGGEYYDDELTQEEIDALIADGYIVEDLPKAQKGGENRDKWGRHAIDPWYGFDAKTKKFTVKDQWGRKPGDEWYGFDPTIKKYVKGSKASKNPYMPKIVSAEEKYHDGPIDPVDWVWGLPIGLPAATQLAGATGAMSLPGMAAVPGATWGNLVNSGFIANSLYSTPGNAKDWYDVSQGNKSWQEAALGSAEIAAGLYGSGTGWRSLVDDAAKLRAPRVAPVQVPVKSEKEKVLDYLNETGLLPQKPTKSFGTMIGNQADWDNYIRHFYEGTDPIYMGTAENSAYAKGYYLPDYNLGLDKGGRSLRSNTGQTGLFGMPAENLSDFAPAKRWEIFDTPISKNQDGGSLPKAQFGMFNKWKKKNVDQVIQDAEPVEGYQEIPEMTAYGSDAKKKLQKTLMDKANALWDTVQGRRVWMENGPKNYSIEELQKFVNGVKDYNKEAQRYERDKRLVEKGELDTGVYAQRYNEGNWARFDQNTGRENYKGEYQQAVDEGMQRKQDNYELVKEFGKEMSGYNSAKRIANDPLGTVEGVVQTGADALMLPFAVNKGLYNYFAEDDFDMGINPLTGLPYGEGFNETMDVASVLPLFRGARTVLNPAIRNAYTGISRMPSTKVLLQSAEQRLGNATAYDLLSGAKTGVRGTVAKKYFENAQKSLAQQQNKIGNQIFKARRAGNDALADELLLKNEGLWEQSVQLDKQYANWRKQYSGLPIEETGMGGGEGRIYSINDDPTQLVKVGKSFNTADEVDKLIEVGKNYQYPGAQFAFPTRQVRFSGGKGVTQFMPKLDYQGGLPPSTSTQDLAKVAEDMSQHGIGIDYYGMGNIGQVGNDMGFVDLAYIGKPGQRTKAFTHNPSIFDPSKSNYGFKLQEIADNAANLMSEANIQGQGFRHGGFLPEAQFGMFSGMTMGQEIDLTPEQEAYLRKQGYKLERV